eukprot:6464650-Amphidinium_carterae.1
MHFLGPAGRHVLARLRETSERCLEHMLPPAEWFRPIQAPEGHRFKNERSAASVTHIFTDGAAVHPSSSALRIAAWSAVFYTSEGGREVMSGRVPTLATFRQTAFEGELLGVVHAAVHSQGAVAIHCDNQSVVLGANRVLSGIRRRHKEKYPKLWDILQGANRPGLSVTKVKAHQKEPDRHDPAWLCWRGNADADAEAGIVLQLSGAEAEAQQSMEKLVYGLREVWRLHIAIVVQQNDTERFDFLVDAILPTQAWQDPEASSRDRKRKESSPHGRPDYPKWLQDLVLEGMTSLPGLCLGQKKRGVLVKPKGKKGRGRCLDTAIQLPVGSFLGEGHQIQSFRHAGTGPEIGLVCMNCGAYSTGHW